MLVNFSKILFSVLLIVLNNVEAWKFSKTEISLYVIAISVESFI